MTPWETSCSCVVYVCRCLPPTSDTSRASACRSDCPTTPARGPRTFRAWSLSVCSCTERAGRTGCFRKDWLVTQTTRRTCAIDWYPVSGESCRRTRPTTYVVRPGRAGSAGQRHWALFSVPSGNGGPRRHECAWDRPSAPGPPAQVLRKGARQVSAEPFVDTLPGHLMPALPRRVAGRLLRGAGAAQDV